MRHADRKAKIPVMDVFKYSIERFFDAYAARFNAALAGDETHIDAIVGAFAPCFVEASPLGVQCSKNDASFREALPKGYAFYRSIGTQSMKIEHKEVTILDEYHAMVKVHWVAAYTPAGKAPFTIAFDVFYFLQHLKEDLKVFAYITGDEQRVLKEYGLIRSEPLLLFVQLLQSCQGFGFPLLLQDAERRCGPLFAVAYRAAFAGSVYSPGSNAGVVYKTHQLQHRLVQHRSQRYTYHFIALL